MRSALLLALVTISSGWFPLRPHTTLPRGLRYFNLDPSADIMQEQYVTEYSFEEPQQQHFSFIRALLRYLGRDSDQED